MNVSLLLHSTSVRITKSSSRLHIPLTPTVQSSPTPSLCVRISILRQCLSGQGGCNGRPLVTVVGQAFSSPSSTCESLIQPTLDAFQSVFISFPSSLLFITPLSVEGAESQGYHSHSTFWLHLLKKMLRITGQVMRRIWG